MVAVIITIIVSGAEPDRSTRWVAADKFATAGLVPDTGDVEGSKQVEKSHSKWALLSLV